MPPTGFAPSRPSVSKTRLEACGSAVPRSRATAPSAYPVKPKSMDAEQGLSKTEPGSKLEQEYIYNLQQQVYLQELELKYVKQQKASTTFGASTGEPMNSSHNTKGSVIHQEEDRHNELREEALRAVMHEKRAHAEKTKVVDQLAKVREQFSSQRQELTAEVVGLQRELEKCFLTEKTLRTELEQASTQLQGLRAFTDGADAQARQGESEGRGAERAREGGGGSTRGGGRGRAHPRGGLRWTRAPSQPRPMCGACAGADEGFAAGGECAEADRGGGAGGQPAEGGAGGAGEVQRL